MTDRDRLGHIIEAIEKIENSLKGTDKEMFLRNEDLKDASYGRLVMISEAVTRLSKELKDEHKEIEWHLITGFRNIIVHEYFRINWNIVWEIVSEDMPILKKKIVELLGVIE
ncbi:MAG: DUF86 domain-containing protein [Chitinophagaceae bacterium]|nr:DUF86 domain-containing protein [Chitinophagaceae bacterium]